MLPTRLSGQLAWPWSQVWSSPAGAAAALSRRPLGDTGDWAPLWALCCWCGRSPPLFSCKVYLLLEDPSPSLPHLRLSPDLLLVVLGLQSRVEENALFGGL